jgi:hypothetical protein
LRGGGLNVPRPVFTHRFSFVEIFFEAGSAGARDGMSRDERAKARSIAGILFRAPHRVRVKSGTNAAPKALTALANRFASRPQPDRPNQPTGIARIFGKVSDTLSAIANTFRGLGFNTPEKIFRNIERGTVGARPRPRPRPGDAKGDLKFQTAYQGSPHDFDEFDTSKIGTGEGNRAYGHGLRHPEEVDHVGEADQKRLCRWWFPPNEVAILEPPAAMIDPRANLRISQDVGRAMIYSAGDG